MVEPLWYYSQDGRECGPVPMPRLVDLAAAGTLRPTDLVWREGMSDWAPAGQIKGLFAAPPAQTPAGGPASSASGKPHQAPPRIQFALARTFGDLLRPGARAAQGLLIAGVVLVVMVRGCDGLADRNLARLEAKQALARQQFDDDGELNRLRLQQAIEKLTADKSERSADDQKELDRLRKELGTLPKHQAEARKALSEGDWRDLEIAARNAKWDNAMWGYWRQLLFVFGSLCFTVGLIVVGSSSQGADRWFALAMLAIIVYSIYVGGVAWGTGIHGPLP